MIDIHSHQSTPISNDEFGRVVKGMDANNLRLLVNLSGSSGDRLRRGVEAIKHSSYADRMVLFANVDFRSIGPGSGAKAAKQLEADINAGAVGLKVFKDLGMFDQKADGSRLRVDDPELDPIWETCARMNVPVLIHVAEPQAFFDPLDYNNERWLELSLYPDRRHQDGVRFEQLMTERNAMVKKHPNTKLHPRALRLARERPGQGGQAALTRTRMSTTTSPRCSTTSAASRARRTSSSSATRTGFSSARTATSPTSTLITGASSRPTTRYFDYYRDYHAFWKLYGIGLPDQVLRKLYYQNALKLTPGIPRAGFTD